MIRKERLCCVKRTEGEREMVVQGRGGRGEGEDHIVEVASTASQATESLWKVVDAGPLLAVPGSVSVTPVPG